MKQALFSLLLAATLFCSCSPTPTPPDTALSLPPKLSQPDSSMSVSQETSIPESESSAESAEPDPIDTWIAGMTLEQKIGQLFFARCPEQNAEMDLQQYHLGGYLLFARDFTGKSPDEVRAMTASYQEATDVPLLIGVDEEGGIVNRVSRYALLRKSPFSSPQKLFSSGGLDAIQQDTIEKSQFLLDLGINVNLAPVCDVSTNPDDYIYSRTFGQDAEQTSCYVKTVVSEMAEAGIGSVLKHFPGYGSNQDTHVGFAVDERPYRDFTEQDFLPFSAGIAAGAGAVLVGHVIVSAIDPELPASLSPKVHTVLRDDLGFTGVAMTDDLVMDAIVRTYGVCEAAVLAIEGGNDLLISTDYPRQIEAITAAIADGTLTEERIEQSVRRILCWKQQLGLFPAS